MTYGKKKIEGSTILKTTKHMMIREDGNSAFGDIKVHIEKGGDCRMFVEIPQYVCTVLPWARLSNTSVEFVAKDARVYGRDPASVLKGYDELAKLYADRKTTLVLQPKILVMYEGFNDGKRTRGFASSSAQVAIKLSVFRYLYEPEKDARPRGSLTLDRITGTFYKWRDGEESPLERTSIYSGDGDVRMFDYTDELWEKVTAMRDGFSRGVDQLNEIMHHKDFAGLLLSGLGPRMLTGPGG